MALQETVYARRHDTGVGGVRRRRLLWRISSFAALAAFVAISIYHWMVYVSHQDRPHLLTALDRVFNLGVAAAVVCGGVLLGLRCLTYLRVQSLLGRVETVGIATGLGLALLGLVVLMLGMFSLYYPPVFIALLIL